MRYRSTPEPAIALRVDNVAEVLQKSAAWLPERALGRRDHDRRSSAHLQTDLHALNRCRGHFGQDSSGTVGEKGREEEPPVCRQMSRKALGL